MAKYTIHNKTIHFSTKFNESISTHEFIKLLTNIDTIIFSDGKYTDLSTFNKKIILTSNIKVLKLGYYFNKPLNLQPNIKILTLGHYFNQPIVLTKNIIVLSLSFYFDKLLVLTSNIQYLTFGSDFNQHLVLIPKITHITFGCKFNKPIILTSKITNVSFGDSFNQPIVLSKNIKHLTFQCIEFRQPLILTKNMTHLRGFFYNPIILTPRLLYFRREEYTIIDDNIILTENIVHLTIVNNGNPNIVDTLPNSLKKISYAICGNQLNNLPNLLTVLKFRSPIGTKCFS